MELPEELAAMLRLVDAGVRDPVGVGFEHRDGPGVGGSMGALALTQPVEEVVAGLTAAHGPPETGGDGPPWLRGPFWSRRHDTELEFQAVRIIVLDGVEHRPHFVAAEQVPDDATGFVLVDRAYGLRNPPTTYEQVQRPPLHPPPPRSPRRPSWWDRLLGR
ncbi:MAG: hypothetical protein AAGF02_02275 [Actinomycetota bacterium]